MKNIFLLIAILVAIPVMAQTHTFPPLDTNNAYSGNETRGGTETFANLNKIIFVDGAAYTTVQAAVTAACSGNGVVYIPANETYVGPTTFCSNLTIKSWNLSYFSAPTVFTYTAPLKIANLHGLDIEGIRFDFVGYSGSSPAITMSSISASRIDIEISNVPNTAVGLLQTCTNSAGNMAYNDFQRIIVSGGSEGIKWSGLGGGSVTCSITENRYGMLQAFSPSAAPASTWTAFHVAQDSDSNTVEQSHIYSSLAQTNGWIFNSANPGSDYGADYWKVNYFDTTPLGVLVSFLAPSNAILVNSSVGIDVWTGVVNYPGGHQFVVTGASSARRHVSTDYDYMMESLLWGSAQPPLCFAPGFDTSTQACLKPASGFTNGVTWTLPNADGNVALATGTPTAGHLATWADSAHVQDGGLPLMVQRFRTTGISGDQAISANTLTTVASVSLTMPSTTGNYRVMCNWTMYATGASSPTWDGYVTDVLADVETNSFAGGNEATIAGNLYQGESGSGLSPVYTASTAVTFRMKAKGNGAFTVKQHPQNAGPDSTLACFIVTSQ